MFFDDEYTRGEDCTLQEFFWKCAADLQADLRKGRPSSTSGWMTASEREKIKSIVVSSFGDAIRNNPEVFYNPCVVITGNSNVHMLDIEGEPTCMSLDLFASSRQICSSASIDTSSLQLAFYEDGSYMITL